MKTEIMVNMQDCIDSNELKSDILVLEYIKMKNTSGNNNLTIQEYSESYFKEYNSKMLKFRDGKILSESDKILILDGATELLLNGIFQVGNIFSDKNVHGFTNLKDYFAYRQKMIDKKRNEYLDTLKEISPSMKYFVELVPKNKKEIQYWDAIESLINKVEQYFDISQSDVDRNYIVSKERCYQTKRGIKKEGIMIKAQPYAKQYTFNIYTILGNQTFDVTIQKLYGGYQYGMIIRANKFYTKQELIDNIIMNHVTSLLIPTNSIVTDTAYLPVYMSAYNFWNSHPEYKYNGVDPKFYIQKSGIDIDELEKSDE